MRKETKLKISSIVKMYTDVFVAEFNDFKFGMRKKRESLQDSKFAQIKNSDFIERALYEMPETLFELLTNRLDLEEINELKTKDGGRWFAKTFKDFRISEKI